MDSPAPFHASRSQGASENSPLKSPSPGPSLHPDQSTRKESQEEETSDNVSCRDDHLSAERASVASPDSTAEGNQRRGKRRKGLRRIVKKLNPALTLQNSGSVARDHLASERTFLAYVRTSLTIASMGVALVQLLTIAGDENQRLARYSRPLGATIIIIGLCTLFLGVARYFMVQCALVEGNFPVARVSTVLVAVALCAIITAVFGILLANKN